MSDSAMAKLDLAIELLFKTVISNATVQKSLSSLVSGKCVSERLLRIHLVFILRGLPESINQMLLNMLFRRISKDDILTLLSTIAVKVSGISRLIKFWWLVEIVLGIHFMH